jgi:two-component system LytT family response regulator
MSLRTVVVDDEPLARELLTLLLADHDDIQVVMECGSGREAVSYLKPEHVDLLFLDVKMPKIDGFDVIEQVGLQHLPPTVFVTAYHEHAVQAFEVHAVGYLTKPVAPERLETALKRVREKIAAKIALLTQEQFSAMMTGLRNSEESRSYPSRLLIKDGEKEILLPVERVDWIEAAQYYCCLHTNGRQYMLRETITELNNRLDPRQFVRVHRSSIVNLDRIREIYRDGHGEGSIVLTDGLKLRMSKVGRQKLAELGKA